MHNNYNPFNFCRLLSSAIPSIIRGHVCALTPPRFPFLLFFSSSSLWHCTSVSRKPKCQISNTLPPKRSDSWNFRIKLHTTRSQLLRCSSSFIFFCVRQTKRRDRWIGRPSTRPIRGSSMDWRTCGQAGRWGGQANSYIPNSAPRRKRGRCDGIGLGIGIGIEVGTGGGRWAYLFWCSHVPNDVDGGGRGKSMVQWLSFSKNNLFLEITHF